MKKGAQKYLLVLLVLGLFLPVFNARADISSWIFGNIAYPVVSNLFAFSLQIVFSAIGTLMGALVQLLAWTVNIRIYTNVPVIQESWKIMRDFANMLFIIALVVMAYGTIFNIKGYDFRSLIAKFLIAALLINFSLVIGGLIIDGTQIINNTFLNAMGDISGQLGKGLDATRLLPNSKNLAEGGEAISNLTFSAIFTLLFGIFMLFAIVVSVATPLVVAFVRIPILWALLIVSPMAWLLSILPATKGAYNKWWHQFLGWNLFLPYYLFFLYFALYFLSNMPKVIEGLGQTFVNDRVTGLTGLGGNFTFSLIFSYVMVAVFLIGGTKVAMNAGRFSGTGIVSAGKWGRGVAMRRLGVTAAQRGAMQRLEQVKKEGLPGRWGTLYGGEYGLEQQTGRFGRAFGVRGAEIANQRAFVERAGKDYADFERKYQNGQMTEEEVVRMANQFKAADPRGYAYRKLAAKIGQLDPALFASTLQQLSDNPLAAEDFAKTAAGAKFSKMKGSDLAKMAAAESGPGYDYSFLQNNVAARREMFRYVMTDKKAMSGLNDGQIRAGVRAFGGHTTADAKSFMKEIGKVNPEYIVKYNLDSTVSSDPDLRTIAEEGFQKAYSVPHTSEFQLRSHSYGSYLKSGDIKDTASIKVDTWRVDEFKEAVKTYIGQLRGRARNQYVNRLERELVNTANGDEKIRILYTDILGPAYAGAGALPTGIPPAAPRPPLP